LMLRVLEQLQLLFYRRIWPCYRLQC
jgi:hypothetical protein